MANVLDTHPKTSYFILGAAGLKVGEMLMKKIARKKRRARR